KKLKIGTNVWPGYELLYLAKDLGYYENTPIKLFEYDSASEVMEAFKKGHLDVAALTMDEVFLISQHDASVRFFLITDFSQGGDVILGAKGIHKMTDLQGKRVGVETTALGAFFLTRALENSGMKPGDVKVVHFEVHKHEKAFTEKQVDAVVTFDPVRTNLIKKGAKVLFDSSMIPGEIVDVLAAREEAIGNRRGEFSALVAGWFKALEYLKTNPEDAVKRMAPREGISPAQFSISLKGIHIPDKKENLEFLTGEYSPIYKNMVTLSMIMFEKGLLKKNIVPRRMIDPRPITKTIE
ncbi:MAG: ABC transporter substrate-binding protein, partial [Nitrospinota bacterium]